MSWNECGKGQGDGAGAGFQGWAEGALGDEPGAGEQEPEAEQGFVEVEVHREGYGVFAEALGLDDLGVVEAWQGVEGQGYCDENEQAVAEVAGIAVVLWLDGEAGEQEQGDGDAGLEGQLTVGECQDVTGGEHGEVRPGEAEHGGRPWWGLRWFGHLGRCGREGQSMLEG